MTTDNEQPAVAAAQDFVVDMPDMPLPSATPQEDIKDSFEGAFKFAFIGAGQGGSRIAEAFYAAGYGRVVAINTAEQDLAPINLPANRKLALGGGGAGKNPKVAAQVFKTKREDVLDLMRKGFGRNVDRVFICVGAGGGTGCGCAEPLVELAEEFMQAIGKTPKIGMIVATPKRTEGKTVNANAYELVDRMMDMTVRQGPPRVSPLILVDNERIDALYPGLPVAAFWNTANKSVASLFHLFNTIAIKESAYTSFDQTDYQTLLDSGLIVFGAMPVANWRDETAVSYAVRENLRHNLLAGSIDLATGSIAGAIVVGGKTVLDAIPQRNLEHAFEQLSRILKGGNTVHRGIYKGAKESLVVYTIIGGLAEPKGYLAELSKLGGLSS